MVEHVVRFGTRPEWNDSEDDGYVYSGPVLWFGTRPQWNVSDS